MGSGGGPARLVGWPVSWAVAQWGWGLFSFLLFYFISLFSLFPFFCFIFVPFYFSFIKINTST